MKLEQLLFWLLALGLIYENTSFGFQPKTQSHCVSGVQSEKPR